jgi:hypothetical protein
MLNRVLQGIQLEEDVAHGIIMIIKQFKKTALPSTFNLHSSLEVSNKSVT